MTVFAPRRERQLLNKPRNCRRSQNGVTIPQGLPLHKTTTAGLIFLRTQASVVFPV
jgi:hypothetical protein